MDGIKNRPAVIVFTGIIFGVLVGEKICGYKNCALICLSAILILTCFKNRFIKFLYNSKAEQNKKLFNLLLLLCLSLISGYLLIQPFVSPILPKNHIYYYADLKQKQTIIGVVSSEPLCKKEKCKFEVSVNFIKKHNKKIPVSGKIIVSWIIEKGGGIYKGDLIELNAKIRSIRNFNNPGGFDYEKYMAFKKIYVSSFVYKDKLKIIKKKAEETKYLINELRNNFSELIEKLPYKEEKQVLKALLIGKKDEIPEDIRKAFNNSGASHILAISGLHVGIAVFISFFIFTKIFSLFKNFTEKGIVKKVSAFLTIIIAIMYGFFAGMSPSTQRAVIMTAVFLCSFIFEEEADTLNSLALSGIIILIIYPASLFSISFILSFTAVFAISYGLKKTGVKGRNKILIFFLVSVFATIGTLPIILYNFNSLCLIGPFTNFIVIPIIGFLTVPIGLASALIYPLSVKLSFFLLTASASVLSGAIEFIKIVSSIPYVSVTTITPNIMEILSFYAIIISLFNIKKSNFARNTALFAALILCADSAYWIKERFLSQELRITVIDVGQGNSALIEFPKGECMLIDGGGFSDKSDFDVGEFITAPFLRRKKIRTVKTIAATHPDSDHINGLTYIAENFFVKNLWSNNEAKDTKGYKSLLNAVKNNNIKNIDFQKLHGSHAINGVKLDILYPMRNFAELKKKQSWRNTNNNSLVLKLEYGDFSFLFTGDIKKKAEKELVKIAGSRLKSQIMLAPHHGSKTSSSGILLNAASPALVVISAGFNNRYGFPHTRVINNYKKIGCEILRTDINGAVEIKSFGKAFRYNTYVKPPFING
ncbi:MAG: DNA internalization-related competence protein ComEC/Rec2 [Deltaproteobacteria bacterium]|nr:DNA internalization-related competence protein ComEC/Rec2 [Deltaproteobacteria bacterium]